MGKKQTRVNRGARSGGHEQKTTVTAKEQAGTSAVGETPRPLVQQVAHKKERRFGHN
ncbi:hypothetical protein J7E93_27535 [Streptomyces sp. ISL-36]|uniref:hypothetical protein n=1 Tax=Streptomyces sp. ISL-36 TaxID=2819182 RepID=UPI001BED25A1|nr:hypothetical protein [Streptomyces sp. ISL-36]MBT2443784.1 hypothetical protein [Streptomyces sp. ISL-36]